MRQPAALLLFLLPLPACGVAVAGEAPHLARVTPPAARVSVPEAIRAGVEFLVENQNADGSFGKRTVGRSYELWCHVPGGHQAFQAASSALCWLGLDDTPYATEKSRAAQARCLQWLVANARVKRAYAQQFYNIWAFGYGLRALGQALRTKAPGAAPEDIAATMSAIIAALAVYQSPDGGWGYLDFKVPAYKPSWSTCFTTATVLVGLHEARLAGMKVPQEMIDRAVRYVWKSRTPDGNYVYSIDHKYRPRGLINRTGGSSLRNQACNHALSLFDGKMDVPALRRGLAQLVEGHRFAIAGVRRPRPHESWYAVSGYFYLYGHQYAGTLLAGMPKADQQAYWPHVVRAVLQTRQLDGSFWDYPVFGYHKFYGTGYALMTLSRCPKDIARGLDP